MGGSGGAAKKTQEQIAMEKRQRRELNEEVGASERRLKATAQKKIGKASLLGRPMEQAEAPKGPMITEGFQMSGGRVKKIPKRSSLFSKLLRTSYSTSDVGKGLTSGKSLVEGAMK